MEGPPNKERIARSFLRGRETYDKHAGVQREIGRRLIGLLADFPAIRYERVLEIGCCTGTMTEIFLDRHAAGLLYLNDLVADFFETVQARFVGRTPTAIAPLFGDIESLELPARLDLVLSSSTFQWLIDLPGFFAKVARALTDHGYLAFSLFGPGTLIEFKQLTGVGLQYRTLANILEMLKNDFVVHFSDTDRYQIFFTSPRDVLRHLQATGVGGVSEFRWTSKALRNFEEQYTRWFQTTTGIPVTYVSSCVIASKK